MRIDPLLLEEYNEGVERAVHAYYNATSPAAVEERNERRRERNRLNKASERVRKGSRGRAA